MGDVHDSTSRPADTFERTERCAAKTTNQPRVPQSGSKNPSLTVVATSFEHRPRFHFYQRSQSHCCHFDSHNFGDDPAPFQGCRRPPSAASTGPSAVPHSAHRRRRAVERFVGLKTPFLYSVKKDDKKDHFRTVELKRRPAPKLRGIMQVLAQCGSTRRESSTCQHAQLPSVLCHNKPSVS